MAIFEAKGLSFTYPLGNVKALNGVNTTINEGDFVLIMGKSGCGKTTLLKLLTTSLAPAGEISGEIKSSANSVGFVNQNPDLTFVSQTVRGELAFALENQGLTNCQIAVRIGELASFFNIADILDSDISNLSGGTRSTVAIAAAIINNSKALILDEPFSQLDPKATNELSSLLKRINDELGITIVMSSHSSAEVIDICDRIIIMENGEIVCDASPSDAVKNDKLLPYFPVYTSIFDERPLTVKAAVKLNKTLEEKPLTVEKEAKASVEAKNITFAYSKHDKDILSRLSYKAYEGKINCIIGANGSGKTTLLKTIAGIKRAYSGKVKANGKIAYMPQNVNYLFTKDRVADEISEDTARLLDLTNQLEQNPLDLSGGQAQRVAFGVLLEQNADILLLDEPTRSFDAFNKKTLAGLLRRLCEQNKTIIIVSHDLDFVGEIADYVSFLSDGIISMSGGRREVLSSLGFFTTSVRRITASRLENAVAVEDLV